MKRQKIPSLLCLLSICATTWEKETVTGLFAKDVILPCPFPPGDDEVIYWKKEENDVHSYYYRRDHLESQHLNYRNRTQVFNEHIPHGNASLKLSNLTLTDKGLYLCYVGTQQTKTEVEVELHVQVASYYALEYHKNDTERMLTCSAFLTYPEPNITWVIGNKPIQETRREETRDGILYSLQSHQSIITTSDPYSCHIHLPQGRWTAEWRMKDQLAKAEGSSIAIPCEFSSDTLHREGISVVWILNRNSVTSVLAAFNGTSHSYQPRVRINQSDFSLLLSDLTTSDSGEYLCNMSTPHYTKLTVRTLEVEHSDTSWITVTTVVVVVIVLAVIGLAAIGVYLCRKTNKTSEDPQTTGCTSIHLGPNYHFSSVQLQNSTKLVCVKTCKLLCLGDCCDHIASNLISLYICPIYYCYQVRRTYGSPPDRLIEPIPLR